MFSLSHTFLFRFSELPFLDLACRLGHMVLTFLSGVLVSAWSACLCVCFRARVSWVSWCVRVCNPCPLSLSVYGAVWECRISPGLRARAGDAVRASDSSSGGGEEERGALRYPTPPPPHPAGNALPANHAAAGFPASSPMPHHSAPVRPSWHLEEHGD